MLYRLAAHEALHAALHQRDETLATLRLRLELDVASAVGVFAELAGVAADEYRIERALNDEGLTLSPPKASLVPETLTALRREILAGIALHQPGATIEPTFHAVMSAFHRTNRLFVYVAAEELASGGSIAPDISHADRQRLIGDHYDEFRDGLARLTPASQPTNVDDLVPVAEDLAVIIYAWL